MELIASLSCLTAADVLQWCGATGFDGHLAFRQHERTVELSCDAGRIIQVSASDRLESFGRHLYSQGLVEEGDLAAAGEKHHLRLGERLVELGLLSQSQVLGALRDHTLNVACSVVQWKDGIVSAHAAKLRPLDEIEPPPLDAVLAVMEAARREDEIERIRPLLPHDNVELASAETELLDLDPPLRRVLEVLEPGDTLSDLYGRIGGSRFFFLKALYDLIERLAIVRVAVGEPPPALERRPSSIVDVLLDRDLDLRLRA